MNLTLRNPHSVLAAIETRPGDIVEVKAPGFHGFLGSSDPGR